MAENCFKCAKAIAKDALIECSAAECQRSYHRSCVNIDKILYDAIQTNPNLSFRCEKCKTKAPTTSMSDKIKEMEEKIAKLSTCVNQMQARLNMQYMKMNGNSGDGKNLFLVGNNNKKNNLNVVCDFGRWVQVGKFAVTTTEQDIIDHLADALKLNKQQIKCVKLVKNDANLSKMSYCKFKITIPEFRFNELFNETIWPSGVMVSQFKPRAQVNQHQHRI